MVVLKGIPSLLTPELLYALAKMGHGDELVLADANFPVSSVCKSGPMEIRADGLRIPELLEAILKLFPLDSYVECPAAVMDLVESDRQRGLVVPVWPCYSDLLKQAGSDSFTCSPLGHVSFLWVLWFLGFSGFFPHHKNMLGNFDAIERFAFYERAKKAFAVVATGETALYGNIIIKKGVIHPEELC
ncbi:fucose mutarotase isoform X1 [Ictalurus punctatus]|uniref:L-fucose mutarotase n=1 Tax=Ictalurus punctatus TaxID=7998 RepID=A0A9F7RI48_ICTPU|nr:fucose mutarotase isoform X1 [Ictalurus punctatus]